MIKSILNLFYSMFPGVINFGRFVQPNSLTLFNVGTILFSFYFLIWMLSVRNRDLSLIDTLWGYSFLVQTAYYYLKSMDHTIFDTFTTERFIWEKFIFLILILIYGVRLSIYSMLMGTPALGMLDKKWGKLSDKFGKHFWWISFIYVFMPVMFVNFAMGTTINVFDNLNKESINYFKFWTGILTMVAGEIFQFIGRF